MLRLADQRIVGFLETGTLAAKLLTVFFARAEKDGKRLRLTGQSGIIYTKTVVKLCVRLKRTLIAVVLVSVLVAVSATCVWLCTIQRPCKKSSKSQIIGRRNSCKLPSFGTMVLGRPHLQATGTRLRAI